MGGDCRLVTVGGTAGRCLGVRLWPTHLTTLCMLSLHMPLHSAPSPCHTGFLRWAAQLSSEASDLTSVCSTEASLGHTSLPPETNLPRVSCAA